MLKFGNWNLEFEMNWRLGKENKTENRKLEKKRKHTCWAPGPKSLEPGPVHHVRARPPVLPRVRAFAAVLMHGPACHPLTKSGRAAPWDS